MSASESKLGFAVLWEGQDKLRTWSGTATCLRDALKYTAPLQDLELSTNRKEYILPKILARLNFSVSNPAAAWRYSASACAATEHLVKSMSRDSRPAAILMIGDLARGPVTCDSGYYVDMTYAQVLRHARTETGLTGPSQRRLKMLERRQCRLFRSARAIFTMSTWTRDSVISDYGIPEDRVHTARPGPNACAIVSCKGRSEARLGGRSKRLLFIGRDFHRKGGDVVLDVAQAAAHDDLPWEFLFAGCTPPSGPLPRTAKFLGDLTPSQTHELLNDADILLLPSRFEALGIAPLEALNHSVPVIVSAVGGLAELGALPGVRLTDRSAPDLRHQIECAFDEQHSGLSLREGPQKAGYDWNASAELIVDKLLGRIDKETV